MSARRRRRLRDAVRFEGLDPVRHNARVAVRRARVRYGRLDASRHLLERFGIEWMQRYWL